MSSPADNQRYGKGGSWKDITAHNLVNFKLHSFTDEDMDKYNQHEIKIYDRLSNLFYHSYTAN